MSYQVIIPKPVQKQLDNLPDSVRERVVKRILVLKENPRPRGCVKLKGYENEYRIRIGDYRFAVRGPQPGVHRPIAPLQASEGCVQRLI